nr:reverse transcriptase domain-containing protein [Tanacetum cinerariifolium]
MMTTDQFFRLEKDNPHDHIRWFNKITSTNKYKDVPSSAIKLMLFPFSLARKARRWLEKEPPHLIHTWEDLVSKFINEFFPPSRTTNLHNEILNFQQRFDESFHEAWDRYKNLLRACPHHDFTELHQLDTFYNALNPADQDSLNATVGGNLLERSTQDVLTIIENKSKVRNSRSKPVVSQVKACDVNSNSSSEIAKLTHAVNQQTGDVTTAMTAMLKQFQATPPPAPVKAVEETCCLAAGGNTFPELRDNIKGYVLAAAVNYSQGNPGYRPPSMANQIRPPGSGSLPSNTVANPKGKLKAITTRSGLAIDGPTVPTHPQSINPEVDERIEETFTDPDLVEYTIKVPPPPKMLKALISNKEKLQELANIPLNENCSAVILKKLPEKLGDPGKFLIPCGFNVFIPVGKFTFPTDFVIVDYESDPGVPLILGRPFLRIARALIDIHDEEMILRDGDERLTLNIRYDTSSYSNQPQKESINLIKVFNNSSEDFLKAPFPNQPSGNSTFSPHPELTSPEVNNDIFDSEGCNVLSEKLLDLDLHPPLHDNPFSGSTTYFSNPLLEEFTDELPPEYDDNLHLKNSIDQKGLANLADIFVDSIPEMFTKHALDYSSPTIFDEYDDDLEVESNAGNVYDDPFYSKREKIKESKLLIDELDLLCDFHPPSEYDSFISQDFSRVDALPSTNNEDKIFNPGILIQEKLVEIITRVVQDKKLAISNAFLVLEDFNPPFYEPLFFKEIPKSKDACNAPLRKEDVMS